MATMERLSSVVQVRRRRALADAASRSRSVARVGAVYQSDVRALNDEMASLFGRIRREAIAGVDGMADLLSSYSIFLSAWRSQLTDWGYDENLEIPWYRVDPFKATANQDLFAEYKSRNVGYGNKYARLKYPGAPVDLPSDYGAPLPPVVPGEAESSTTTEPTPTPQASLVGARQTSLIVLIVAAVAAVGGYLILSKGPV